jgi:cation diffusion facilitator family transporter
VSTHAARPAGPARERRKQRAITLSIISAVILTTVKLVVAFFTGSLAVFSEAVHSLTDIVAASIALLALRRAAHPPDSRHRYGHEKLENVSAIAEGVIILLFICFVVAEAIERLAGQAHEVTTPLLAASVMVASAVVNLAIATHLRRVARETESAAVEADAQHLMTDVYTSGATAIGLGLLGITGYDRLDAVVALVVSALVIRIGLQLIVGSTRVLLDEGLPAGEIAMIERLIDIEGVEGLTGFHRLRTRRAGSRRYVDLHLTLDENLPLWRAHELAHQVEQAIEAHIDNVDVLIHIEPDTVAPPPGEDVGAGD